MIVIGDIAVRPEHAPLSDDDRVRRVQHCESIEIRVRSDANSRARLTIACCEESDVVVEGNFIAESNVPRVSGDFDRLNPTSPTKLNSPQTKPPASQSAQAAEPRLVNLFDHRANGAVTRPSV